MLKNAKTTFVFLIGFQIILSLNLPGGRKIADQEDYPY